MKTNLPNFISFNYCKINEINIGSILNRTLSRGNLPECIVEIIERYLFSNKKKSIKFFYEKKCDDYRKTRETAYKIFAMDYYDFAIMYTKTILFKYFALNLQCVIPHLRRDMYYFKECNMNTPHFLVNKNFMNINYLAILVLFCEVYNDYENCETYYCLYDRTSNKLNKKYLSFMNQIERQIE